MEMKPLIGTSSGGGKGCAKTELFVRTKNNIIIQQRQILLRPI